MLQTNRYIGKLLKTISGIPNIAILGK